MGPTFSSEAGARPTADDEWTPQKPLKMAWLIAVNVAYVAFGGYTVWRYRRRWFPAWLGAFLIWATLCKYLICVRCEFFDRPCDYCYGGKYAALFFRGQRGRPLDMDSLFWEGVSTSTFASLPVLSARGHRLSMAAYIFLLAVAQATLLKVCCSRCVKYSRDEWKRLYCPNYRIASFLFDDRR